MWRIVDMDINNDTSVQIHSLLKTSGLKATIQSLRDRKQRITNTMSVKARYLRRNEGIDYDAINDYLKLNQELRTIKIYEAELVYLKNML
jgi:predicted nucleic acid-binding protein